MITIRLYVVAKVFYLLSCAQLGLSQINSTNWRTWINRLNTTNSTNTTNSLTAGSNSTSGSSGTSVKLSASCTTSACGSTITSVSNSNSTSLNTTTGQTSSSLTTNNVSISSATTWNLVNGVASIGNWTGNWSQLLQSLDNPFGIVFDYPNTTVNRSTCSPQLASILGMAYPTYVTDVVQNSWWTIEHVNQLEANGAISAQRLLHSSNRQLNTQLICTAMVCKGSTQVVHAKGCNQLCGNARRMTAERNINPVMSRGKNGMVDTKMHTSLKRNRRNQVDLSYLAGCLQSACNYNRNQTNYLYQGWKESVVQVRGNMVATLFYSLVDQHASATCKPILNSMTHWIYPIVCL